MHPHGAEVVICTAGEMLLTQEFPDGRVERTMLGAGEYALASLLAGSGWKTFPIFQAQAQNVDGRIASALAIIGLLYVLVVSLSLLYISGRRRGGAGPGMPVATK